MTLQDSAPVCLTHAKTKNFNEPVRGSLQTCVVFVGIRYVNGRNYAQSRVALGIYQISHELYFSSQRRDVRWQDDSRQPSAKNSPRQSHHSQDHPSGEVATFIQCSIGPHLSRPEAPRHIRRISGRSKGSVASASCCDCCTY